MVFYFVRNVSDRRFSFINSRAVLMEIQLFLVFETSPPVKLQCVFKVRRVTNGYIYFLRNKIIENSPVKVFISPHSQHHEHILYLHLFYF